jgi:hypothetical protein
MSYLPLFFALVAVVSLVLPTLYRLLRGGPREMKGVVEYAQKRGYALVNPALAQAVDLSPIEMMKNQTFVNLNRASLDIYDIQKLDRGTGDWLAFICKLGSKEVTIFNLTIPSQRTDGRGSDLHHKVAKIKAAGLPRFSLARNSAMHTFENVVENIAHVPQAEIHLDARQYPNFAKHFWIRGSDAGEVTSFLSDGKIRFLETANLGGTLATNANYLVYFEDGKLQTEQDFDSFIARAEAIVANFL